MSSPASDGIVHCSTAAFSFCFSTADVRPLSISTISRARIVPEAHVEGKVSDGRVVDEPPRRHMCLARGLQGPHRVTLVTWENSVGWDCKRPVMPSFLRGILDHTSGRTRIE